MQPLRPIFTKLVNQRPLLLCIISATLLLAVVALILRTPLPYTEIKKVKILGATSAEVQIAVRDIVKTHLHESFWSLDVNKVKESLHESPLIDLVVVQKAFPNTLLVKLKQNRFVARVNDNAVFTKNGELVIGLNLSTSAPQIIVDEHLVSSAWEVFVHVNDVLRLHGIKLKTLEMSGRGAVTLTLTDEVVVRLGKNEIFARLGRFSRSYEALKALHQDKIKVVDCRYTSGMAVG